MRNKTLSQRLYRFALFFLAFAAAGSPLPSAHADPFGSSRRDAEATQESQDAYRKIVTTANTLSGQINDIQKSGHALAADADNVNPAIAENLRKEIKDLKALFHAFHALHSTGSGS